jgi:hypothetical protein
VVTKLTLLLATSKNHQLVGLCNTSEQRQNKNVLNENTKKIGEEGRTSDSKLKHLKNNHERTSG